MEYDIKKVLCETRIVMEKVYLKYEQKVNNNLSRTQNTLNVKYRNIIKTRTKNLEKEYQKLDIEIEKSNNYICDFIQDLICTIQQSLLLEGMKIIDYYEISNFNDREKLSGVMWEQQDKFDELAEKKYKEFKLFIANLQKEMARRNWDDHESFELFYNLLAESMDKTYKPMRQSTTMYADKLKEISNNLSDELTSISLDLADKYIYDISSNFKSKASSTNYSNSGKYSNDFLYFKNNFENNLDMIVNEKIEKILKELPMLGDKYSILKKDKGIINHNCKEKLFGFISYMKEFLVYEIKEIFEEKTNSLSIDNSTELVVQINKDNLDVHKSVNEELLNDKYLDKSYRIRHIDSYKTLHDFAIDSGYTLKRYHGSHGIYENEAGKVIPIPQHKIGKGLSIHIQKCIIGIK